MDPNSLGRLCIDRGHLTEAQLEQCLLIQRSEPNWRRLGEILLSEGLLTGVTLANMLSIQEALRSAGPGQPAATGSRPPPSELGWLLKEGLAYGATSVVLGAGQPPAFVCHGRTELLEGPPLQATQIHKMLAEALEPDFLQDLEAHGMVDVTLDLGSSRSVRITLYRYQGGIGATLRPAPMRVTDIGNLSLPAEARELSRLTDGLVLITGPAGSGKTTSMGALLNAINASRGCHILTLERPLRMWIKARKARVTRREVGRDVATFADGLRHALRADADVIATSEMPDVDAITTALGAAGNGRLVFAGMFTRSAYETIQRIVDAFPRRHGQAVRNMLAGSLRGVLSQRLLPSTDDGPVAVAAEVMLPTPGIANLIREDKTHQIPQILQASQSEGLVSLEESLARLAKRGRITPADAVAAANEPGKLQRLLGPREGTRVGR